MKYTFHITAKQLLLLVIMLKLSVAGFTQSENRIASADKSIQQISEWRIVGPFKDTLKHIRDFTTLVGAGRQSEAGITDTLYHRKIGRIDLGALFKTNAGMVGYGTCKVVSDKDQEIIFFVNADDVMRCWINDSLAFRIPQYTANKAVIRRARLKKGVNILTAEVSNFAGGYWGFGIDITTSKNAADVTSAFLSFIPENSIDSLQQSKVQLTNWRIIGPFNSTLGNIAINQLGYLKSMPENAGLNSIDTLYRQGKDGVDLRNLFNADIRGIAYAVCDVVSAVDQELAFLVNVDDEMQLWKNDDPMFSVTTYTGAGAVIKKVNVKKGVNRLITEIRNTGGGRWWFDVTLCSFEYVRNNALLPRFYISAQKFIISRGEHLSLEVSDPDFIPITRPATVKIFDARNRNCHSGQIELKKGKTFILPDLSPGAYRYELYTDRDTLADYFIYGALNEVYDKEALSTKYKPDKAVYATLLPYMKRLDRLLGDYAKSPDIMLGRKIVYCIYKVKEIDSACINNSPRDLISAGLSLRTFTSTIDLGEENYLLYVPEKLKKQGRPFPLVVMVPYVTNNHPFYAGGVIANADRLTYISKFADKYNMAVLWPSSRIFKWYNQTPIITKAIIESIEDVSKNYPVDKKHVFLYGDCSGGLFALQTAIRRPDLFAAIGVDGPELRSVPADDEEASGMLTNNLFRLAENLYGKPVLFLHSANDQKAPIGQSLLLMDAIKSAGGTCYYDDLNNVFKSANSKLYSEPEAMRKMFSFFYTYKDETADAVKKIATYAFYNDTVYGVAVQEKRVPGKAVVSYHIKESVLHITADNVRKMVIDLEKAGVKDFNTIAIRFNGRQLVKNKDYKKQGAVIAIVNNDRAQEQGNHFTKELAGPVNKVFLKAFALVRPEHASEAATAAIGVIDSLWMDEYRNHVWVIDQKKADSARQRGVNLIYIVDDMRNVPATDLKSGGIELVSDGIKYKGEEYAGKDFSFVFYSGGINGTDNMYLGLPAVDIPAGMLKGIFLQKGWYDFEVWDGSYPVIQGNYEVWR